MHDHEPQARTGRRAESGGVRASDDERSDVVAVLRGAGGEGRLTFEEMDERIAAAYAARFRDELGSLIVDLPTTTSSASPPPSGRRRRARLRAALVIAAAAIAVAGVGGTTGVVIGAAASASTEHHRHHAGHDRFDHRDQAPAPLPGPIPPPGPGPS